MASAIVIAARKQAAFGKLIEGSRTLAERFGVKFNLPEPGGGVYGENLFVARMDYIADLINAIAEEMGPPILEIPEPPRRPRGRPPKNREV